MDYTEEIGNEAAGPERLELVPRGAAVSAADLEPRCSAPGCGRMLARKVTRPWMIDCPRCRFRNVR